MAGVDLEQKLKELIAAAHNVPVGEVTADFIDEQRQALYSQPTHRFTDDRPGLVVQNLTQIEADRVAAQAFLSQFRNP